VHFASNHSSDRFHLASVVHRRKWLRDVYRSSSDGSSSSFSGGAASLATGEAAAEKKTGRILIAWLKGRIFQDYSMANTTATERGKDSILPHAPKKSFPGGGPNRVAHTIAQTRTCHWLYVPYLKRTGMARFLIGAGSVDNGGCC
jgi:hypothetical protein